MSEDNGCLPDADENLLTVCRFLDGQKSVDTTPSPSINLDLIELYVLDQLNRIHHPEQTSHLTPSHANGIQANILRYNDWSVAHLDTLRRLNANF